MDTKTCLETYSTTMIKHRLPAPTDYTIILELEQFIPGSGPEAAAAAKAESSGAGPSSAQLSATDRPQLEDHSARTGPVPLMPPRIPLEGTPSTSSAPGPSVAQLPSASNPAKRKADASPVVDNPRRLKLVFREGEKTEAPATGPA